MSSTGQTMEAGGPAETGRRLKGWHVAACMGGAFLTIVTANMALVVAATGSFPGLVVANSYIASQDFEARKAAFADTGLTLAPAWEDGRLTLGVTGEDGATVDGLHVTASIGRPTFDSADRMIVLLPVEAGYGAPLALEPGRWQAHFVLSGENGAPVQMTHRFTISR
ncbi:MAG: FixH family protein [Pseudomonadota bacterium]